ncbi:hypothetical protein NPIL_304371 [Nephila pilipes]|uniref:Uncharacterized protein n=1 Tax=Nephila pilipes TaxID=299642 RepID=A0A8X6Q9T7_NEPPI|nr:hypothetical protein NPIL_304371 [Nephila pilipes]
MEQEARCSFQGICDETYVLSRKQEHVMNEIRKRRDIVIMEQEAQWKFKVAEVTAESDVVKMERDVLKTKEIECKMERDALKTDCDVIKTERDMIKTEQNDLLDEIA